MPKTAFDRVQEFKRRDSEKFTLHCDGDILFCSTCNTFIDHKKTDRIIDHFNGARHLQKVERKRALELTTPGCANKKQKTIQGTLALNVKEKNSIINDWILACAGCNMSLHKSDSPQMRYFLETHVKGGGSIPGYKCLLQRHLPKVYEDQKTAVKEELKGKYLALIVDETTDEFQNKYLLNILATELSFLDDSRPPFILATIELEVTNHSTVAQACTKTVANYGFDFNNILAFVTDNASYMKKCYNDILKGLFPNCIHVTCFAHICALLGECWRKTFKIADDLVRTMKKLFKNSPFRKQKLKEILNKSENRSTALPPTPVLTRWNTWFQAVDYHRQHLEDYSKLVQCLKEHGNSCIIEELESLLQEVGLQSQLNFISEHSQVLMDTLTSFESRTRLSSTVFNTVSDLRIILRGKQNATTALLRKAVFRDCAEKLEHYIFGGGQPASEFFRLVRVFDPLQIPLIGSTEFSTYEGRLPLIKHDLEAEWLIYLDMAKEITEASFDLKKFWKCASVRLPKLSPIAIALLTIPANSVDAERSFSLLRQIQGPQRASNSVKSLEMYSGLSNNFNFIRF